jgi:hypothetical protein
VAFTFQGSKPYPALSAALEAEVEAKEYPFLAAVQDPNGLYITEDVKDSIQGRKLVGGILAWYIREIVEVEGEAAARAWVRLAFEATGFFTAPEFTEAEP